MKDLVSNYTFNAAAKTVTFTDYGSIVAERIFIVANVTDGILIYNFADAGVTGTVATNVLTVTYDTTTMSNTDDLLIIYDDPAVTTQAVSGTVTANAGTNLNTSLLALEAGGNLAAVAASLGIVDDWDESDRAKTNPIVGQAGVQGGSGVVSATTQRVVLATDIALPAGTNNIGDVDVLTLPALPAGTNNIGDVDVLTLPALPAGANLIGLVQLRDGAGAETLEFANADYDTGAGTVNQSMIGIALPASGGPVAGGTATDPFRIDPTGTTTQPVSGTVTANAGTNLNTSALALEAGGNLAGAATSLAIVDDWDESDRAKVNPIVGQAGVQGNTGVVTALTQRVVLATDIALPTGTNSIGQVTANAGTNLNTSALALESGGNLAGAATSLAVVDDWDESDRAKVNPIVGQAGVQGGAGASTALTQRVAIATDANAVVSTGNVAHDAADSGNPTKNGAKAVDFGADPTEVSALDRVDNLATRHGMLWVLAGHPNILHANVTMSTATTSDLITATASERIIVTELSAFASDDNTGNVSVLVNHDLSGADTRIVKHPGVPIGSGFVKGTGAGVISVGPVGGKVEVTTDAAQTVEVDITYFKIPSA